MKNTDLLQPSELANGEILRREMARAITLVDISLSKNAASTSPAQLLAFIDGARAKLAAIIAG